MSDRYIGLPSISGRPRTRLSKHDYRTVWLVIAVIVLLGVGGEVLGRLLAQPVGRFEIAATGALQRKQAAPSLTREAILLRGRIGCDYMD